MENEKSRVRLATVEPAAANGLTGAELRKRLLDRSDLMRSGGPWLVFDGDQAVFDGVNAGDGLGYNSGPLFGTAHFAAAWSNDWSDPEIQAVLASWSEFIARKPQWQSRSVDLSQPRRLLRAYISSHVLEQFENSRKALRSTLETVLVESAANCIELRATDFLSRTSVGDRRLTCEFSTSSAQAISRLLKFGVLAECKPDKSIEIEIPLAATQADLELLVERVAGAWLDREPTEATIQIRDYDHYYRFHSHFIANKQMVAAGIPPSIPQVIDYLKQFMPPDLRGHAELHFLTRENWTGFRQAVDQLQKEVYEPVRQTSLATFDPIFEDPFGYGLLVQVDGKIAGMASAGPLVLFPNERGTRDDCCRKDRHTLYPVDLTVALPYRGTLGTYLKRGMALLGLAAGHRAFHGRNRDRMAAAMWAINLSLGSYQIRHLPNDYPDSNQYRDCIYYRCPLRWPKFNPDPEFETASGMERAIAKLLYY